MPSRDRRRGRGLGKAEQAAETRGQLLAVGRALFGDHGFAGTSTEALLAAANVTRGALYYHFTDKADLFRAVCDEVYGEVGARIEARAAAARTAWAALDAGCDAFLDLANDARAVRILFLDGPSVLGREVWEAIELRHGVRPLSEGVAAAMAEGTLRQQPVEPLVAVLNGALNEGVLWAGRQPDRRAAIKMLQATIAGLLRALRTPPKK